jgi:hypothetical protein
VSLRTNSENEQKYNNSLKQTVTRDTHFVEKAKPSPRYGSFYISKIYC